jgi:hypothetical protein
MGVEAAASGLSHGWSKRTRWRAIGLVLTETHVANE